MDRTAALLVALGLAAALYFVSQEADASLAPGYDPIIDPNTGDPMTGTTPPADTQSASGDPVVAFLATIRQFESGGRYDVIFGGGTFDSYADHPRIKVWFYDKRRPLAPGKSVNNWSDAAGAYQYISTTWDAMRNRLSLPDFSPDSQDRAAAQTLTDLGVVRALEAGDVPLAFARASGTWASLPGSTAQQNPQTLAAAVDAYNTNLTA